MADRSNSDPEASSPHVVRTARIPFGMVDSGVIRDRTLPPMVKLVYAYLATYCNSDRSAFPSRATIAKDVGISVRSVDGAIKTAEKVGLFKVVRRRTADDRMHRSSLYLLHDLGGGYLPGGGPRGSAGAAPPSAGAAPDQDNGSTQPLLEDSLAARRHAAARRDENYAQALKHHQHRRTAAGQRSRRSWEKDGVTSSWLTRDNPWLGADIENYVDHKWGAADEVRTLVSDLVHRVGADGQPLSPGKILNFALKEARWDDDEPPSEIAKRGLPDFTPVLSMPVDEQSWYDRDDAWTADEDEWDEPAAVTDPWDAPVLAGTSRNPFD